MPLEAMNVFSSTAFGGKAARMLRVEQHHGKAAGHADCHSVGPNSAPDAAGKPRNAERAETAEHLN